MNKLEKIFSNQEDLIVFLSVAFVLIVLGFFLKELLIKFKILKDKKEGQKIVSQAISKANKTRDDLKKEIEALKKQKERLEEKEDLLISKEKNIQKDLENIENNKEFYQRKKEEVQNQLAQISGITKADALKKVFQNLEKEHNQDLYIQLKKLQTVKKEILDKKAQEIVINAIEKYSKNIDNNLVQSSVKLENPECKGKIIGKEGRNIKAFERQTGVQLLIDQLPDEIIISSFDPIRREVAKKALTNLLKGDVIQPAKIEEEINKAKIDVLETIKKKGRETAEELEIFDLPEEILDLLGRLYYRTSYGQNVLKHSIEMAVMAEMIAKEVGANSYVAKVGALLHDIGKAVDFETKGTHVQIGMDLLKKYEVNEEIIKAMQSHHGEYPNANLEAYIVNAVDSISAARPGARSDNADMYLQKLEGLERITKQFSGVTDAYALSAGREIRVFVKPDEIDDFKASKMAREIALKIEEELKYPGEIKIALIREKRVVEFAR